jgi:hypothetical protein
LQRFPAPKEHSMIRNAVTATLLALALPAAAQSVPAANYSDIWWNPGESGWGVTFTQHSGSNQVFAVWYTYDPREPDATSPGNYKPLWLVMPGGSWTTPTSITGPVYVTHGTPFAQQWGFPTSAGGVPATRVGSFTFNFSNASTGTFAYSISAPAGLASTDPAFNMPSFSGTRSIQRQPF